MIFLGNLILKIASCKRNCSYNYRWNLKNTLNQTFCKKMEKKHCEASDGKAQVNLNCDEVLRQISGTRKWQLWNFLLLCFPSTACGFLGLVIVFTGNTF